MAHWYNAIILSLVTYDVAYDGNVSVPAIEMSCKMPILYKAFVVEEKSVADFALQHIFPFPFLDLMKPTRSTCKI